MQSMATAGASVLPVVPHRHILQARPPDFSPSPDNKAIVPYFMAGQLGASLNKMGELGRGGGGGGGGGGGRVQAQTSTLHHKPFALGYDSYHCPSSHVLYPDDCYL